MANPFPAGRFPPEEGMLALRRLHFGFGGMCGGDKDERGVCNVCGAQLTPEPAPAIEEVDATPDEAFELGRIAGYDEAMREAHAWASEGVAYFERKASGPIGAWWLRQIRKVFGGPIEHSGSTGSTTQGSST